jgi:ribose transport system substrate-binding protein
VRLVREHSSVRVTDLAKLLDVSEGTIRNDLAALDDEQQLTRVRGGAVLRENGETQRWTPPRMRVRAEAKQRIARWAAEMIENGDSILLDASTTVLHMAPFLRDRHNLTVVTNGIEVARSLAENLSNTVILIGGILRADGVLVSGSMSERILKDLHIRRAFVSCAGFSFEAGLTESDIRDAQLKSQMISSADEIIALIDSSKFGKVGITSFVAINQIDHVFTDSEISPQIVEQMGQAGKALTVCEKNTFASYTPHDAQLTHYKIGFANLSEDIIFAVDVRRGLERTLDSTHIDLIAVDNQMDADVALKNADDLIAKGIDLMVEYQIDARVGSLLLRKFQQANIPVIAVDIPVVGATYVGADNYRAGQLAGTALGEWIEQHWHGHADGLILLEEPRAGSLPALRIQGQIDGLFKVIGSLPDSAVLHLNSGNTSEVSETEILAALHKLPNKHRLAVACFNDEAALGALSAARQLGRERDVAIVGQGADRRIREEIRRPGSRIVGSTAFMPEKYGEKLLEVALKLLRGEPVPPAAYIEHKFINASNVDLFYPV